LSPPRSRTRKVVLSLQVRKRVLASLPRSKRPCGGLRLWSPTNRLRTRSSPWSPKKSGESSTSHSWHWLGTSPTDPRWTSTLKAIGEELTVDTLVYRYKTESGVDGLAGAEGAFTACSFWYIECLARAGELEKARLLFEKMLGYANHVGLYAEELGRSGQHLGNYPQALTHLALISAATYLDRALSGNLPNWR